MGGRKMSAGSFIGINNPPGRPPVNGGPRPPMYGPPPPGPGGFGLPPPMMIPGRGGKKGGTFSGRQKGMRAMPPFMMYGGPPGPPGPPMMPPGLPPHLMPPPGHPLYGAGPFPMGGGRPNSRAMEEPIYMPHNARPLSPVASYQPGHFPHEAYYNQQQYATIDKANKHGQHGQSRKSKKKDKSTPLISSDSNAEDSEFGAGIYKKGHINERAFSYSIRNEHRSRSFGSLAEYGPDGEPL